MAKNNDNIVMEAREEAAKKGHNILPKIISVILAFVLWFYVMAVESPINEKTFNDIPVEVTLPWASELTLYSGFNTTVNVTVRGKKSEINQLSAEDFKASADASGYSQAGKYSIPVTITAPEGFNVVDKSISVLSVYLDAKSTTTLPIKIEPHAVLSDGLELGSENEIIKSKAEVTLYGPKSELDKITVARAVVNCGNVSSSVRASGVAIELLDAEDNVVSNPYVTTDITSIDVRIPVFTTKEIELKVNFVNKLLNSSNSEVTLEPSKIKVRGTVDALSSLDEYVIGTIDEKTLTSGKLSLPVILPEGITSVESVANVNVEIEHKGTDTKALTIKDIKVNNPDGLKYELSSSEVELVLRGPTEQLDKMTDKDVSLSIDLSGQSKGTITVPVNVKMSSSYSKTVYEVGEYNLLVTVK